MFERFTADGREVVVSAQAEARSRRDNWVGTEHLLVGLLLSAPDAVVLTDRGVDVDEVRRRIADHVHNPLDADALASIGIDLDEIRRAAEAQFGAGALAPRGSGGRPRFTKRGKKVLELAVREAVRLQDDRIRSLHLLLGILRDGGGLAVQVLRESGVDLDGLRADAEARLQSRAA